MVEGQVLAIGRFQQDLNQNVYVTIVNFGEGNASVNLVGQFHPYLASGISLIDTNGSPG